jgi:hypothetical protein
MPRRIWNVLLILAVLAPLTLGGCTARPAGVVEQVVKETVVVEGEPVVVTATPEEAVVTGGTIIYSDFSDAENAEPHPLFR